MGEDHTSDRNRLLKARLDDYGLDGWKKALSNVEQSRFLRGLERKWRCTFDWLISPSGFAKVHDGAYPADIAAQTKAEIHGFQPFM